MTAAGFAALDAQIARLENLGTFVRDAAPAAADAVREEQEKTIAAGTTPDGRPWAARKEDGGQPLETAGDSLAVVPVGNSIFVRLTGHVARHHKGIAKGGVAREVIPVRGLPGPWASAIKRVLAERFRRAMGGG